MNGPDRPPADFDELVARPARWLSAEGPHADLVLSSRIRLARNLRSVPSRTAPTRSSSRAC